MLEQEIFDTMNSSECHKELIFRTLESAWLYFDSDFISQANSLIKEQNTIETQHGIQTETIWVD